MVHWVEEVASNLERRKREKDIFIGNGGLSVSGLQHVGRLRGEITIVDTVLRVLRDKGYSTRHLLTLYTMDAWKGKETQLRQFSDLEEARSYVGWPLYRVPDPFGCHESWVEHYWEDFGGVLDQFAENVEIVSTKELYEENPRMQEFVLKSVTELREAIIKTINKYRGEKKLDENYIPFQPVCEKCGRIDTTRAIEVDVENFRVKYVCTNCGHEGYQSLKHGKLNWRVEWVGVWYSLNVDFEPYGKDHATPGGSRDSCNDLAVNVYGFEPPQGLAYEWVGYKVRGKDMGDMGSSDFIGFTPKDWVEVAEPEILRYLYLNVPPMRRVVLSLEEVPRYYDVFDKAERVYYGLEHIEDEENVKKAYRFALLTEPPPEPPFQLRYLHALILSQILPSKGENIEEVLARLRETKQLLREPNDFEIERIKKRIRLAKNWLERYAPNYYKIDIVEEPPIEEIRKIVDKQILNILETLLDNLKSIEDWNEENIKNAMINIKKTKSQERRMFQVIYLAFFGRTFGPRIAPYLAMLNKQFVIKRIETVITGLKGDDLT